MEHQISHGLWHETLYPTAGQFFKPGNVLYHEKTPYQNLIIFENDIMGRIMALDGVVQTTERDEFVYHEMMAHVPILAHGQVKSVLIVGGGDGGMLREVCKHQGIEQITMVEIDAKTIEVCSTYLPGHNAGAFDDPRLNLVIDDGVNFVNTTNKRFDVIISDCTDPIGPGEALYTSHFYEGCKKCLKPGGVFVAQNGVCLLQQEEIVDTYNKLSSYFEDVGFYQTAIPTYYGGTMAFAWATDNEALRHLAAKEIEQRFQRAQLKAHFNCRYYNAAIHAASFAMPQYTLDALSLKAINL